jgi:hypothetical protein
MMKNFRLHSSGYSGTRGVTNGVMGSTEPADPHASLLAQLVPVNADSCATLGDQAGPQASLLAQPAQEVSHPDLAPRTRL